MCNWGDSELVQVTIPADLSATGRTRKCFKPIDRCIAPIVAALEAAGIQMRSSCCGHGERNGLIELQDGRRLVIEHESNHLSALQ